MKTVQPIRRNERMKKKSVILGLFFGLCLLVTGAEAGIIEQAGGTSFRNLGFYYPGQTFTAEDAWIDSISFEMKNATINPPASTLTVGLYDWDTNTNALGSHIRSGVSINALPVHQGPNVWVDFGFSGTMLDIGQSYAALFTSPDDDLWDYGVIWNAGESPAALYDGGTALWGTSRTPHENGYDLNFRVTPSAVPIPGSVLLLASGLLSLFGFRKKKAIF
jgi:hypothetical protein